MDLNQSVVVITGSARGVGRAIAEGFAAQSARLALVDILPDELQRTADELRAAGTQTLAVPTDITDPAQVDAMAESILETYGRVDVLVNCAGTFSVIGPVWDVDPEKWFRDIRVNLYGNFLVSHALVGHMVEQGDGYVVNIVSTGGLSDPHPHCTSYASSKTGLMRLTEGLAAETAEHGLKVFAVGPPAIMTDMTRFILEDEGGKKWRPGFDRFFAEGNDYPPESVAETVLAVVSGRADALTGRYFDVRYDLDQLFAEIDDIIEKDRLTLRIRE